jgi:hypothetical protein
MIHESKNVSNGITASLTAINRHQTPDNNRFSSSARFFFPSKFSAGTPAKGFWLERNRCHLDMRKHNRHYFVP